MILNSVKIAKIALGNSSSYMALVVFFSSDLTPEKITGVVRYLPELCKKPTIYLKLILTDLDIYPWHKTTNYVMA